MLVQSALQLDEEITVLSGDLSEVRNNQIFKIWLFLF